MQCVLSPCACCIITICFPLENWRRAITCSLKFKYRTSNNRGCQVFLMSVYVIYNMIAHIYFQKVYQWIHNQFFLNIYNNLYSYRENFEDFFSRCALELVDCFNSPNIYKESRKKLRRYSG